MVAIGGGRRRHLGGLTLQLLDGGLGPAAAMILMVNSDGYMGTNTMPWTRAKHVHIRQLVFKSSNVQPFLRLSSSSRTIPVHEHVHKCTILCQAMTPVYKCAP